ncbi:hypothetical protein V8F06_004417 [Rhypophila decipiens]
MSKRHVNWSDSPTGGSHRRNDSGVGGPFSDSESPKSSNDYGDPYSIPRLQEALLKVSEQKEKYKRKAEELDSDLTKVKAELAKVKKDLAEKEAFGLGVKDRNEILDADNKALQKENKTLQEEVERLEKELRRANRNSNSPPSSMTGALPVEAGSDDKTPRRSNSQRTKVRRGSMSSKDFDRALRHQERAQEEREKQEKEQEMRLRRRMGNSPGDESDANNSKSSSGSRKSHSSRTSYIEPLGEPAPRPPPQQIPQSPRGASSHSRGTAQYPAYSQQQYAAPSYTSHRPEPVSGTVPRSIRPQVYYDGGSAVDEYPPHGGYQHYPLPRR